MRYWYVHLEQRPTKSPGSGAPQEPQPHKYLKSQCNFRYLALGSVGLCSHSPKIIGRDSFPEKVRIFGQFLLSSFLVGPPTAICPHAVCPPFVQVSSPKLDAVPTD